MPFRGTKNLVEHHRTPPFNNPSRFPNPSVYFLQAPTLLTVACRGLRNLIGEVWPTIQTSAYFARFFMPQNGRRGGRLYIHAPISYLGIIRPNVVMLRCDSLASGLSDALRAMRPDVSYKCLDEIGKKRRGEKAKWYPRQDSNLCFWLRRPVLYPTELRGPELILLVNHDRQQEFVLDRSRCCP
jgi:hypothetical protein